MNYFSVGSVLDVNCYFLINNLYYKYIVYLYTNN